MYKLFVIAKNNIKKQKSDMITFFILTLLASFLIFDCISAITGISKILDKKFDEINGAHVMLFTNDTVAEKNAGRKVFEENEKIIDYEVTPYMTMVADYRKKGDRSFNSFNFYVEAYDNEKRIMDITKPVTYLPRDGILLPYNMSTSYAVGDIIQLRLDEDIYDFRVAGFLEDPYFCSTMNISIYFIYMNPDMMDELYDEHKGGFVGKGYINKGIIDENRGYLTTELEAELEDAYKDEMAKYPLEDKQGAGYLIINWDLMKQGSAMLPVMVIAIILIFAVLIMIIAIVIISFSIKNFIRRNMKNTGIMEACGYTVAELRLALTIQITSVAFIGSITGIILGLLTYKGFGNIISVVFGMTWNQPADAATAVVTIIFVTALIAVVAAFVSRVYKKVTVLDALRGGINTHNYKKNLFTFEKTPLPVPVVMALKDTFGGIRRNLLMVFIVSILAISTLVGFCMYENFGTDTKKIMDIMSVEVGDAYASDKSGKVDYEVFIRELESVPSVKCALADSGYSFQVINGNLKQMVSTTAYDDTSKLQAVNMVEGRLPETDNELTVTSGVAKDLNLKVGDVVQVKKDDDETDFIVVGINQSIQNAGRTMIMTLDGVKKLSNNGKVYPSFYVYAKEGVTFSQLQKDIYDYMDEVGYDVEVIDMQGFIDGTVGSVVTAMQALCIIIVFITTFIVIFIESLVIRAKISKEWHGMGVSKALGQTSKGLIIQIMLSNMPAIATGTVIGVLVSKTISKELICTIFSYFELSNLVINLSPVWMVITFIGILAIAIGTAAIEGLKVKKLNPVEMITEE